MDNTDFTASLKQAYFAYNVKYNNSPAFDLNNLYLPLFDSDNKVGVLSFIVDDLSKTYPIDETTVFLINTLRNSLPAISSQLVGTSHSRIIIYCVPGIKSESTESFSLVKDLRNGLKENNFYDKTLVFGDMVSYYDIAQSFSNDRLLVNLLTIVFILTILLLSFRSLVLPIILLTVIQGAIWINFSIYAITLTPMLFMSYLIVSAISMGATIDYAIVVTNRYRELRSQNVAPLEAGISAISNSFSAILTSSTIMIVAGFVIAFISTEPYIFTIGMVLGSGTIISLLMVIFLFSGALAVFALNVAFYSNHIFTVLLAPLVLNVFLSALFQLLNLQSWEPSNFINPAYSSPRMIPFVVETAVLLIITGWEFIYRGRQEDIC